MNQDQKKQVQQAADHASALVKKGIVNNYALAIYMSAKCHVQDPNNLHFLKRAISLELRARYNNKVNRSQNQKQLSLRM